MIIREDQRLNGYSVDDLNKKIRNDWLVQEKLKKLQKQLLDNQQEEDQIYLQNYQKYLRQQLPNEQYIQQSDLQPINSASLKNLPQDFQQDIPYNQNDDLIKLNYKSMKDLQNDPIILNKFHQIMQDSLNDNQSIFKNCEQRKQIEQNISQDQQSVLSDNVSKISISESKFGDLIANHSISQQDLNRLIKDNFAYFKHFLGYCVCFQCDCGMCRCIYVQKDQKKIKFRGAYISLYQKDYKNNLNQKIEETNKFKGINMNLQKNLYFGDYMDKVFDNSDKITSAPKRKLLTWELQPLKKQQNNIPLFDLTTNKQSYQTNGKLQKLDKIYQPEQMPNWINYNQPIGTTYKQDFLNKGIQIQKNCKIPDQNLFPSIPNYPLSTRNSYVSPRISSEVFYENINKQTTIGKLESLNKQASTTNRDTYKNPGQLSCKQTTPDVLLKKLIFEKVDKLIKENQKNSEIQKENSQQQI